MIDLKRPRLSVVRQCMLLQINRSGVYYRPIPENVANLAWMRPQYRLTSLSSRYRFAPVSATGTSYNDAYFSSR